MTKSPKPKKFLQRPDYPGGRKAIHEFIKANLQYPEDALAQQLEGVVTVAYQVTDEGEVESARIVKGLSPTCNEEALRLVKMLQYSKVYNHGVRLKSNHKINIRFQIVRTEQKSLRISYSVTSKKQKKSESQPAENQPQGYSYTLVIHKD